MKSIIQSKKECYFCHKTSVHKHHIYFGGNRKVSDKNGFTVYLCPEHHNLSNYSVHRDIEIDRTLKRLCQTEYEKTGTREEFIKLINRNYLEE